MTTEQTTQSTQAPPAHAQAPPAHAQAPPAHAQGIGREARLRAVLGTGLLVLAVGTGILFADPFTVGALVAIVALLYIFRAVVFSWPGAAVALVFVVCLVPARRYTLPISLPFAADPYRILVLLLLAAVVGALLIDPTFRWRQLEFGAPVGVFLATQLISIGTNVPGLVTSQLAPNAVISLVSLLIICAVFLVTRQIIQSRALLDLTIVTLVLSGTFVGALATVERVTRVNLFLDFFALLPLQRLSQEESVFVKAGTARAFASAQHPIALAVFLVMLVPLGVYLARHATWPHRPGTRELFWIGCTMIMVLGTLAAVSRTAFVSIAVMIVFVVLIRPVIVPRLLFYGLLASAASLAISARNVIGMITELLNPQALIESQMSSPGWTGSGRLADLGPSLEQAAHSPLFGTGLGSRITIGPSANAFILDDQYLTTLLESGIVGVVGLVLLLLIPIGRLAAFAKRAGPPDDRRDLALAVATAFIGYGVALAFFDGLSFIQTVLTFFLLLAFGSWAIGADHERAPVERAILRMRVPT
jgi:hypothetical protein